uniref:Nuclear distribution protein nudE homolog 1 n=1 Tax=Phallusia mammillata TaxID=59560 RepID=A0A6F9DMH8_9ASCI|nr:nuclear distribution protein nudE homolog 1 [Phallusia mammillata]
MAMNDDDPVSFSSVEEELNYWKTNAKRYRELTDEVQQELQEFRECSEEFEKELEVQLEQNEKQMKELKQQNTSLTFEYETLKDRYEKQQEERYRQVSELQNEVAKLTATKQEMTKDIRELEQSNDDLERSNRNTIISLDDFEHRLNQALERNAFLESELDEKDSLATTVQRLRDEARDLHHELSVRQLKGSSNKPEAEADAANHPNPTPDTNHPQTPPVTPSTPTARTKKLFTNGHIPTVTPIKSTPESHRQKHITHNGLERTPLTPSARISALNIVGDLLRKVGALESKLASCRNFVQEQPTWTSKRSNSTKLSESSQGAKSEQHNSRPPATGNVKIRV